MADIVADSAAGPLIITNLLGLFALIAVVLAAVGVYGVISYSVARRTKEIGVRVALGAERGSIMTMIIREGSIPVVAGIAIGLPLALFATRLIAAMLYGVEPTDRITFSVLPIALLTIGILASSIPAMRATRLEATQALRES